MGGAADRTEGPGERVQHARVQLACDGRAFGALHDVLHRGCFERHQRTARVALLDEVIGVDEPGLIVVGIVVEHALERGNPRIVGEFDLACRIAHAVPAGSEKLALAIAVVVARVDVIAVEHDVADFGS